MEPNGVPSENVPTTRECSEGSQQLSSEFVDENVMLIDVENQFVPAHNDIIIVNEAEAAYSAVEVLENNIFVVEMTPEKLYEIYVNTGLTIHEVGMDESELVPEQVGEICLDTAADNLRPNTSSKSVTVNV